MKKMIITLLCLLAAVSGFGHKVILEAPDCVKVSVFEGYTSSNTAVAPVSVKGGLRVYDLPEGCYHFISSGDGYNTLRKNFVVKCKTKRISADPGMASGKGYNPLSMVYAFPDACSSSQAMSVEKLSRKYPRVLSTPCFTKKKPVQEHTTQQEMEEFICNENSRKGNLYSFIAGVSTEGRNLPLVVFTRDNLKGKSIEEAASLVRGNGLPTVFLHAQIHGNEPSAGEGALAMIAELNRSYGNKVLSKVNVIIMPRVNCDGAKAWTRGTSVAPDMNRDNLLVQNPEIKATHKVYNLFLPEIVLDMHEYPVYGRYSKTEGYLDDAGITVSGNLNNTVALNDLMKEMMRFVEREGDKEGLRFWEYTQAGYSDQSPLHASHYYALRGSANFLVETPNALCDKESSFERRVFTQFIAAKTLIDYAAENGEKLCGTVRNDREATASLLDRTIILKYGKNKEEYRYPRKIFDYSDGSVIKDTLFSVRYYEVPLISRSRPSAYVIPKTVSSIDKILETVRHNAIIFYELPEGTGLKLRQYSLNPEWAPSESKQPFVADKVERCVLLDDMEYEFPDGAYVFPTSQEAGLVLCLLFEPDIIKTDKYPITLVQAGFLDLRDLYRSETPIR